MVGAESLSASYFAVQSRIIETSLSSFKGNWYAKRKMFQVNFPSHASFYHGYKMLLHLWGFFNITIIKIVFNNYIVML